MPPHERVSLAPRHIAGLGFAFIAYAAALLAMLAFFDFLAGTLILPFGGVDHGPVGVVSRALLVDLGLLALFGVSHSVMARPAFKARLTRIVAAHLERPTFVFVSALTLGALVLLWQPLPGMLWSAPHEGLAVVIDLLFATGVLLTAASTFQISHTELFGLAQPWTAAHGLPPTKDEFRVPFLYRFVRHPMQLGILITLWATPVMTVGRALLAVAFTAYVLIGLLFEERALLREFGRYYIIYREEVPALVPSVTPQRLVAVGAWLLLANVLADGAIARSGVSVSSMEHGGLVRRFRVVAPASEPQPILFVLHGRGQDGALMRRLVGAELEPLAAARGWIVVYPDGHGRSWNDCRASLRYPAHEANVQDVEFLRALARRLAGTHGADTSRLMALGFENGGHLAHRFAAESGDAVRAVAVVGADLPADSRERCMSGAPTLVVDRAEARPIEMTVRFLSTASLTSRGALTSGR